LSEETIAINVTEFFTYKVYFFGKWALETLNMMSVDASRKTFGKTNKHKVFIIENILSDHDGRNESRDFPLDNDGYIGLEKNSKYESYAEYLKRRKLISSNTLSIE
jgi:hypothetical protein